MGYLRFILSNKRFISFGFLLTLFSSFGQTFLISLYVPDLIYEFELTNTAFGGLYTIATLGSSFILIYVGKLIDNVDLRKYTFYSALTLLTACLTISFANNIIFILLGLLGLRLAGQGLLSHISSTSISKHFDKTRGKALSITALGYSIGEAIFPFFVGILIGIIGWRKSMLVNAIIIGVVLLPFIVFILKNYNHKHEQKEKNKHFAEKSILKLLRDENFYLISILTSILPFMVTGLLFYQLILAEEKGWSIEWLAFCFIGFAFGRIALTLISGKLIDKYSAVRIFPYYLIPFLIGLVLLLISDHPYIAFAYLTLTGISVGFGATLKTAVLAEVYGTKNLGRIRSIFATLMVISTAISPLLFGYLLDSGFSFFNIIFISLIIVFVVSISGFVFKGNYKLIYEG